jgi:predicted nucleotidyltransferase component of viral defense system
MRNDWSAVYQAQNTILDTLKKIEPLIFGGGTALHRVVLSRERRESEDLDFFIDHHGGVSESSALAALIRNVFNEDARIEVLNYHYRPEEQSHRFTCICEGSDEVIKVELLDFTGGRFGDDSFVTSPLYPKTENAYNLILYKMKALCDRQDTVKDLYDLYFLFREYSKPIKIKDLLIDLELKFKATTGYDYGVKEILKALEAKYRNWDIIEKNVFGCNSIEISDAVYGFRDELVEAFINPNSLTLSLSHHDYINNQLTKLDSGITAKEYIDVIEPNRFIEHIVKEFIEK